MRIARFAIGDEVAYGVVGRGPGAMAPARRRQDGAGRSSPSCSGHPFGPGPDAIQLTGTSLPLDDVRLLAPVLPSKVIAVGKNYAGHAREMGGSRPRSPFCFSSPRPPSAGPVTHPVPGHDEQAC